MASLSPSKPERPDHKRSRSAVLKSLVMPSSRTPSPTKASSPSKLSQLDRAPNPSMKDHWKHDSLIRSSDKNQSGQLILGERNQNRLQPWSSSPVKDTSWRMHSPERSGTTARDKLRVEETQSTNAPLVYNKENSQPSLMAAPDTHTPIWAQFSSQHPSHTPQFDFGLPLDCKEHRDKHISQPGYQPRGHYISSISSTSTGTNHTMDRGWDIASERPSSKSSASSHASSKRDSKVLAAIAKFNGTQVQDSRKGVALTQDTLDVAFEAVLARRNIPEKMRATMRLLDPIVKAEFIRHGSPEDSDNRINEPQPQKTSMWNTLRRGRAKSTTEKEMPIVETSSPTKRGRSRGRAETTNTSTTSPSKRARSNSRPRSLFSLKNLSSSSLHRMGLDGASDSKEEPTSPGGAAEGLRRPSDFITYLRETPRPEDVEVGKLHKLRLLLRNESVSWVDAFIAQEGMKVILDLLERVRNMTWREEHEDLVLHEVLLCLKGLCTTQNALDELATASSILFPNLLRMLFDEERRGPAEFNTRGVVVNLMFLFLSSSPPEQTCARARLLLSYFADPRPSDEEKPIGFLLEMQEKRHQARPFLLWCKEFNNVTKEVFWIFMHHQNVIALPTQSGVTPAGTYRERHFPKTRPPEALNPWIGGVEWEATSYLATHVDLMNGLIASLDSQSDRNQVRRQLRDSGFEKVMGSLRLCKEKFYPAPHDVARDWVAAALEDGWDVNDVRMGPSRNQTSSSSGSKESDAPKLELLKLDL